MASSRKQWSDLSSTQQQAIVVAGVLEVVVTTIALVDLVRRPREQFVTEV